jgi:hypothetical protein
MVMVAAYVAVVEDVITKVVAFTNRLSLSDLNKLYIRRIGIRL